MKSLATIIISKLNVVEVITENRHYLGLCETIFTIFVTITVNYCINQTTNRLIRKAIDNLFDCQNTA